MIDNGTITAHPVVIAVSHAGRGYSEAMRARLAFAPAQLRSLEDRYADLLVSGDAFAAYAPIIETVPRAWIDLNRAEADRDPQWAFGPAIASNRIPAARPGFRARAGLGLIPTHLPPLGAIWRAPLPREDLAERITTIHRPFHECIARRLDDARQRHGQALLLDVHSMPSLGPGAARIVVGDRHGASAGAWLTRAVDDHFTRAGLKVAINAPYAGGHTLARHGQPIRGRHAVQLEIDRALYLDAALDQPGGGLPAIGALILSLCETLARLLTQTCDAAPQNRPEGQSAATTTF